MKHTAFDAQIKSSLEQLEVPYEPGAWDLLRHKMNQTLVEEIPAPVSDVDKAVFHKLQHIEMPYQSAHWDMLARRMADARRLTRRIWISKIAEAAIFLLLIVNIEGLVDWSVQERARPAARPKSNRPQVDIPAKNLKGKQYAAVAGQQADPANFSEYALFLQTPDYMETVAIPFLPSEQPGFFRVDPMNPGAQSTIFDTPADLNNNAFTVFAAIPVQDVPLVRNASMFRAPLFPVKPARSHKMYAATFANFNHNMIKSSGDTRSASGYGSGISVGYRTGKWAVEAGISYAQASYTPKKEIEIYAGNLQNGYVGTYASAVSADFFSIPVKATRKIAQMGHTSVHATAGLTGNVSVQKAYQYKTVEYGSAPSTQPNPDEQPQPQLSRKGTGLLEKNGRLAGNFYATADAGIRIQRPIGKRLTAYVEPSYHQALGKSGLGPKANRINTLSLNAGVLASL
jgi:hypothetical protein